MEAHRWLAAGFVVLVLVSFPFLLFALGLGWVHRWMEVGLRKLTFNRRGLIFPDKGSFTYPDVQSRPSVSSGSTSFV